MIPFPQAETRPWGQRQSSLGWIWGPPAAALLLLCLVQASGRNVSLFLGLQRDGLALQGVPWAHITLLGDAAVAPLVLLPLWRRHPRLLWAAVIGGIFATAFTQGLKSLVLELRPPALLDVPVIGPRLLTHGFPSGHSATAFLLGGLLTCGLPALAGAGRWLALSVAVLIGVSRCVVGVHWPVDVLGGALGGWLSAVAGLAITGRGAWWVGGGRWIPPGALAITGVALLFSHHTGYEQAFRFQQCFAALMLILGAGATVWPPPALPSDPGPSPPPPLV